MNVQRPGKLRRWVGAVGRRVARRRCVTWPEPVGPPIEQIASDLRRLLWQHDVLVRSAPDGGWDRRLWSLEVGIAYRAVQAGRALAVPLQEQPVAPVLDRPRLTRLLRAVAAEGVVLPASVVLLAPESRR